MINIQINCMTTYLYCVPNLGKVSRPPCRICSPPAGRCRSGRCWNRNGTRWRCSNSAGRRSSCCTLRPSLTISTPSLRISEKHIQGIRSVFGSINPSVTISPATPAARHLRPCVTSRSAWWSWRTPSPGLRCGAGTTARPWGGWASPSSMSTFLSSLCLCTSRTSRR